MAEFIPVHSRLDLAGDDWLLKSYIGEDWLLRNAHHPTKDRSLAIMGWNTAPVVVR